jgi:hypothetical protein
MKKERIVVLCLCIILSGSIHTQWFAWTWQHALPSQAQRFGSNWNGAQTGAAKSAQPFSAPSNLATALACSAWPPFGILYHDAILVGKWLKATPEDRHPAEQNPSTPAHYSRLQR